MKIKRSKIVHVIAIPVIVAGVLGPIAAPVASASVAAPVTATSGPDTFYHA